MLRAEALRVGGIGLKIHPEATIRSFMQSSPGPARRMYLFRDEYIFELETTVIGETAQLGHATYIFAKPRNVETFLGLYTRTTKSCIQRNDENVAERLGFLRRVVHGDNPHSWLKNTRQIIGENPVLPSGAMPAQAYLVDFLSALQARVCPSQKAFVRTQIQINCDRNCGIGVIAGRRNSSQRPLP
jgi:hypothetical protein